MRLLGRRELLAGFALFPALTPLRAAGFDFVLIILGPPGSGKSTQARNLSKKYNVKEVSVPGLLKESRGKKKIKRSDPLAASVESGELLNDAETNDLVTQRLKRGDLRPGFILDGYPNTPAQAQHLEKLLAELAYSGVKVISLDVPDAVAMQRMQTRDRVDDTPQNIRRRLEAYHAETKKIRDIYSGARLISVDGTKSELEVQASIEKALGLK